MISSYDILLRIWLVSKYYGADSLPCCLFTEFVAYFFFPVIYINNQSALTLDPAGREKQYKDRLAAWHVRKNIKAKEVHLMIRKQQKRAARGKETAFRVNGQNVDPKRIARFLRRYGNSWDRDRDQDRDRDVEDQSPEPSMFIISD